MSPAPVEDEVLNSRDKVLRAAEEELKKVVRVATAAVIEDVDDISNANVTRSQVQAVVERVFKELKWLPPQETDIS